MTFSNDEYAEFQSLISHRTCDSLLSNSTMCPIQMISPFPNSVHILPFSIPPHKIEKREYEYGGE